MAVIGSPIAPEPTGTERLDILRHRQIVVAGADRRFLRLAAFFLARRGHGVTTTADVGEAFDLVGLHDADVAILDCSAAPAAAVRLVGDIETHYPSVATFIVADEPAEVDAPEVRWKWKALRRLPEDVELASSLASRGSPRP